MGYRALLRLHASHRTGCQDAVYDRDGEIVCHITPTTCDKDLARKVPKFSNPDIYFLRCCHYYFFAN